MHFLFISSFLGPSIGGLETLMARMTNWLLNKGHKVTLLVNVIPDGCRELFSPRTGIVELGSRLPDLFFYQRARAAWADLRIERPDVIKAFDIPASWIVSTLSSAINPAPKAVFGNYFAYVIPKSRNPMKHATYKLFLRNLRQNFSDDSILCMAEEQISEFRQYYGHHRSPIFWPLPVEDPSKKGFERTPQWGRMVSIGRLDPMKEYNLYMIDIVARLRQKGYPVTWTVYGEGVYADDMKARIRALGVEDSIAMKGKLEYSQFATSLKDAYLFVGMGTSIIEASLCGVPGVVTLAHDKSGVTYGPLYRFRFGNCGALMDTPPDTTVEDQIKRILELRKQEYEEEAQRTRESAKAYDMDSSMERFLEIVANSSPSTPSYMLFCGYYLYGMTQGLKQKQKRKAVR